MSYDINSQQIDIENLFKQNENDLASIKELYRKLKEIEKKISQIKYIDNSLIKKLEKEFEKIKLDLENEFEKIKLDYKNLKKIITDENIQVQLNNKIEEIKLQLNNNNIDLFTVKRVAHRGYSGLAPENTIPAYEKASEYGFWGGECDVVETLDHEFVLMHDDTVDRTTNGVGNVSSFTLQELKSLNIDFGSNISSYPNLKIPTLEEYLICCKKTGLVPVIEIKNISDNSIDKFLDIIRSYSLINKAIVISFNYELLVKIRNREKRLILQPLLNLTQTNIDKCAELGNNTHIDCPEAQVTKELVEYANKKGVLVNTWTVNNKTRLNELISYGIDFITTDNLYDENSLASKIKTLSKQSSLIANQISVIQLGASSTTVGKTYDELINKAQISNRCSTVNRFYKSLNDTVVIDIPDEYKVTLMPFGTEGTYLRDYGWFSKGERDISTHNDVEFYHLYFAKVDGSNFNDKDIENIKAKVSITFKTRTPISKDRKYNFLINQAPMVLQTGYSEDTCTVVYDGDTTKTFTLTHSKPLTSNKIGIVIPNISLASDWDLELRVKGESKNGFKFGFLKKSTKTLLTETELNSIGWLYFNFVHLG